MGQNRLYRGFSTDEDFIAVGKENKTRSRRILQMCEQKGLFHKKTKKENYSCVIKAGTVLKILTKFICYRTRECLHQRRLRWK